MMLWLVAGAAVAVGSVTAQPEDLEVTAPDTVQTDEVFVVEAEASNSESVGITGDTDGFVFEEWITFEDSIATTPAPEDVPVELGPDDDIRTGTTEFEPKDIALAGELSAPSEEGTYSFTVRANSDDAEPIEQELTIEVVEPEAGPFTVTELEPAEAEIESGDSIDVTAEITNEGAPGTATIEFSIADRTETRNVTVDDEPVVVEFADIGADLQPGEYTYTVATDFDTREGTLVVESDDPADDAELITAPEAVAPNDEFTIAVTADDVDQVIIDGELAGFTVVEFNEFAQSLATNPDPDELPTELEASDEISTGQIGVGEITLSVELNATVAEGEYELTATAADTQADAPGESETVTVNVTEDTATAPDEWLDSGLTNEQFEAVIEDDTTEPLFTRDEMSNAFTEYFEQPTQEINGVEVSREDMSNIFDYYFDSRT